MRWIGRDPIHYSGGDNLFMYVRGNPIDYTDPEGLADLKSDSIGFHRYIEFKDGTQIGFYPKFWNNWRKYNNPVDRGKKSKKDPVLKNNDSPEFENHLEQCIRDDMKDPPTWWPWTNCQHWANDMWKCAEKKLKEATSAE
jgi:hypothetical protein